MEAETPKSIYILLLSRIYLIVYFIVDMDRATPCTLSSPATAVTIAVGIAATINPANTASVIQGEQPGGFNFIYPCELFLGVWMLVIKLHLLKETLVCFLLRHTFRHKNMFHNLTTTNR